MKKKKNQPDQEIDHGNATTITVSPNGIDLALLNEDFLSNQILLDLSPDMIMVFDHHFRFILINKTAAEIFRQYFPENLIGKTLQEADPEGKQLQTQVDLAACFTGETIHRKAVKSSLAERYFDLYYTPVKNGERIAAVMLSTREVTEAVLAKQAMENAMNALQERNQFIETIIDASQNYIAVYDQETRLITVNPACEEMLGGKRENFIGKKLLEIFPYAKGSKSQMDLLRALSGEVVQNEVYYSPLTDRYIQNCLTPLRNSTGSIYAVLATAYDMTSIKKSEEAVNILNKQLIQAQRIAHIGSWEWDLKSNKITWSEELYRIFGIDPTMHQITFENYLTLVHPAEKEYLMERIDQALAGSVPYDIVHRIVRPDGMMRTMHAKGEVICNEAGDQYLFSGTAQDITETLEMKHKLMQSEIRHHLMIDQVEDYSIIFLNAEGLIQDWNAGAQKIKGYTEGEIMGKHFSVFYPKEEQRNHLPQRLLAEAMKNKKAFHEGWRVRKDGSKFWASVLITALRGENQQLIGYAKLTRDLTEQKLAAEQLSLQTERIVQQNAELEKINLELANQKAFAELLIEENPLMILSYNKELIVNTWNKKSEEHTNIAKSDVLGKNMYQAFPDYDNEQWRRVNHDVLIKGKSLHFPKIKFVYSEGWGESYVTPLRNTRKDIIGLLSITKDITETVKMNEDIEKKNSDLEKMNKELASYSYIASHDLQEPLRKILTFSSRLLDKHRDKLAEEALTLMSKIETSALRMKTLIQDLLEYSRLESYESQMAPVDLQNIMSHVLNDFELLIEQKQAQIDCGPLPIIQGIALQMNQLFYNLLSNALKFSAENQAPHIMISSRTLRADEVSANEALNPSLPYCEISVADNGIGFDQKFAEKIFITFQRLNSINDYPGTGIGLASSKKIVENHKGQIFATSALQVGTVFHILLPLHRPSDTHGGKTTAK